MYSTAHHPPNPAPAGPPAAATRSPKLRQREFIAAARNLLEPSPVRLHHVPNWFRLRLLRAYGCDRGDTSGFAMLCFATTGCACSLPTWIDHWGSCDHRGKTAFVTEPYSLAPADLQQIDAIAKRCGIAWHITSNSWWFPGSTIRVLLYESEAGK